MSELTTQQLLDMPRFALKRASGALLEASTYLHTIRANRAWEIAFESFSAYLNDVGISDSSASKLISVYEHFCIKGGFSLAKIEGIDTEKLYLASKLSGTPEKQLASATTLTRRDILDELHSKDGVDCEHEPITICRKCSKRLQ